MSCQKIFKSWRDRSQKVSRRDRKRDKEDRKAVEDQNNNEFQPKLLKKVDSINESGSLADKEVTPETYEKPPDMKSCEPLVIHNHLNTSSLQTFLDPENSHFYVVGVIGMKDSGKSEILNLLATGKSQKLKPVFTDFTKGNGINAFITEERIFLLDSAPLCDNTNCRDFIVSEADDLRQIQALFRVCNELLVVFESHQIMNLLRMLTCAKNMMKPFECDEPVVTLVENRTRKGSARTQISDIAKNVLNKSQISNSVNFVQIPDFIEHESDAMEVIRELKDEIVTRKEKKAFEDPTETEKTWWDGFVKMDMVGDYFMKGYESLKDKYYQVNL